MRVLNEKSLLYIIEEQKWVVIGKANWSSKLFLSQCKHFALKPYFYSLQFYNKIAYASLS